MMFEHAGADNDGNVSESEFVHIVTEFFCDDAIFTAEQLIKVFQYIDIDQSKSISRVELASALASIPEPVAPSWAQDTNWVHTGQKPAAEEKPTAEQKSASEQKLAAENIQKVTQQRFETVEARLQSVELASHANECLPDSFVDKLKPADVEVDLQRFERKLDSKAKL
jgi:Ca2+-binding EF-hand superfamily protein